MSGSASVRAKWLTEPHGSTFDTSSERWAFTSDSLRKVAPILESSGIRGTRTHAIEATREGPHQVSGTLVADVTPLFLDWWLPYILGATESSDTFATAETLPEFDIWCDRVGGLFKYTGCKVNSATFRGSNGSLISVSMDIIGEAEATASSGFPTVDLGVTTADYPYAFTDSTVSLFGGSRSIDDFELKIDNALVPAGYNTAQITCLTESDRLVSFRTTTKFTSTELSEIYDQTAAAGTLTFTHGMDAGLTWVGTMGRFQPNVQAPIVDGSPEIRLPLEGMIRGQGVTSNVPGAEISFTNDSVVSA